MDSSGFQFGSESKPKPVENPSNFPLSEHSMMGMWFGNAIFVTAWTILWMVFLAVVVFPTVLEALRIIYNG